MSIGERPKVTKIGVEFDDGTQRSFPYADGTMPLALFWEDETVIDILGEFYGNGSGSHEMTYDELVTYFGKWRAETICQPGQTIVLTKEKIETLWTTPGDDGKLLGLMSKLPRTKCAG